MNEGKLSITVSFDYGNDVHETVFADSLQMYTRPIIGVVERLEALVEMV